MTAVTVVLPTYNEAENLPRIAARILDVLPDARLWVADDASPDGTGALADELARTDGRVSVLHRPGKKGLGRAYIDAFRRILDESDAARIVQMDADFSHPPERLPDLLAALDDADLALGSRYVPGGGIRGWSAHRLWLSRFGSWYARLWLGLAVHDLTGGFKAWRRELLQGVLEFSIGSSGYAFQVETTYCAARLGARIAEVPIVFEDRTRGASKMSLAIAGEAIWRVPCARFRHARAVRIEHAKKI